MLLPAPTLWMIEMFANFAPGKTQINCLPTNTKQTQMGRFVNNVKIKKKK